MKIIMFLIIISIFSIVVLSLFAPNDLYTIDSAIISYNLNGNGLLTVDKSYNIRMLKPYRFITLYEYLKFGKFLFKPKLTSSKPAKIAYNFSSEKFSAKLLFSKNMDTRIIPSSNGDAITLHLFYTVDGITEIGKDYKLVSMKVWNEDIDTNVSKVIFNYTGPKPIDYKIYSSSPYKMLKNTSNTISYEFSNIKPNQAVVFDAYYGDSLNPTEFYKIDKSKKEIQESTYTKIKTIRILWYIIFPVFIIVVYVLIFKFFGTEYSSDYGDYFRDIPTNDSPILVNSIIKLSLSHPDKDGINSLMLKMVQDEVIEFIKNNKSKIIGFEIKNSPKDEYEKKFLELFTPERKVIFKDFERSLKADQSRAKRFYEDFNDFKDYVLYKANSKRLFSKKGYIISIIIGISSMLNSFVIIFDLSAHYNALASITNVAKISSIATFAIGIIPFFLNPVVFGRWTKDGIEYYRKWKGLEKFLSDYSLISEKPPQALTLWNDYLIYATALGIGNKVRKTIDKLNVKEVQNNDIYYGSRGYYLASIYYMSSIGAPKSSSSGGFSGTSSGGGFGGGGMSAG